jgi:hypothetical protein
LAVSVQDNANGELIVMRTGCQDETDLTARLLFLEEYASRGQSSSVSPRGGYGSSASTPHSSSGAASYGGGNGGGSVGGGSGGSNGPAPGAAPASMLQQAGGYTGAAAAVVSAAQLGSPAAAGLFNTSPRKFLYFRALI